MKPSTLESYEYASLLPNEYDYEDIPDSVHPTPPDYRNRSSLSSFFLCIPKSWVDSKKSILNNTPFATIILLLNNMIGSGILVQAFIFKKTGIIAAFFEYLIVGLMTYTGVHLMIRAAEHVQIFEYSELANEALGWGGAKLVDASIAVGMFGAIMSYIIIIGSLSESILLSFMEPHWYTSSSIWSIFLVGTFVFPMCCIRHFGHLAYVSYASIVTIGLTMLLVLVVGLLSLESNKSEHLNYGSLPGTMDMIGTVIFAFNFSSAIFHAYEALQKEDRNIQTFSSVAKWTTFSGVVLSFMFGFIGYLSFREDTNMDILENFSGSLGLTFKLIFVVHLVLYIPGDYVIMRYSGFKVCGCDASSADKYSYYALTSIILGAATFLSSLIQIFYSTSYSLSLILGLTGGVANSIFGFIIPAILAIRLLPHDIATLLSATVLLVFGCSIPFFVITSISMQKTTL